uniref:Uncharacterized protein n=1 Tax=Daucus carota subsp. sativus TaxID=79200 RepID=A0A166CN10_DAUCS
MVSAFGKLDDDQRLWEPAWRACSERIYSQQSQGSNLVTVLSGQNSANPKPIKEEVSFSGTTGCSASASSSENNLALLLSTLTSNQPTGADKIVEVKDILLEETSHAVNVARLYAEVAAAHTAAAVSNCSDVWSHLNKLKNSYVRCDDETKLSSAAMAISAAASVAKAAASAAKLASNIAVEAKIMAALKKRVKASSAAVKHAENFDAIVKASELAAAAVSQVGIIISNGNHLP